MGHFRDDPQFKVYFLCYCRLDRQRLLESESEEEEEEEEEEVGGASGEEGDDEAIEIIQRKAIRDHLEERQYILLESDNEK